MKILRGTSNSRLKLRRYLEGRSEIIDASTAKKLRFYQFKPSTAEFFFDRLRKTDIVIEDTPHYQLAKALAGNAGLAEAEKYYTDYLSASWGANRAPEFAARVEAFKAHFRAFQAGERMPKPTVSYFGKEPFNVDGNHRVAFAAALGKPIRAEILPPDLAMLLFSKATEFYGTGYRGMPYQSVYLNGTAIIEGRRADARERIAMIPRRVLEGKAVLDVASNIGMSSLLAKSAGAASCCGLEISSKMVDLATRFSMFEGSFPNVRFRQFNVDEDALPTDAVYDTAFMFSIYSHLKKPERLMNIARDNVRSFVVFEGHPGSKRKNYASFLDSGLFTKVSEVGALPESRFDQSEARMRPLWICEK